MVKYFLKPWYKEEIIERDNKIALRDLVGVELFLNDF